MAANRDRSGKKIIRTRANRNIKLEKKLFKIDAPTGYANAMGSKVKYGKETPIVVNLKTGEAGKIKGSLRNAKENIVKGIARADEKKYETPSKFKARIKKEKIAESKPAKKVPVKPRGGLRGGGSLGGGGGMNRTNR